jgi:hypothetical protein
LLVCLSASSLWGYAYKSVYQEKSKKRYGNSGNSFVCAVEFGEVKLYYWGNSSDPKSKHFNDQSEMYQKGNSKTCFLQRRCRKTERTKVPSWRINTKLKPLERNFFKGF